MPKEIRRFPRYTLVWRVDLEEVGVVSGLRALELRFRGPKCTAKQRVLANGTLPEILPLVRERWGQDGVTFVVDLAVALQRNQISDELYDAA